MTSSSLLNTFNGLGLATTASNSAATANSSSSSAGNANVLTQNDFLKLLTTQLKNQDPTNPSDSNTMIQQMAQFSTVTGINSLLSSFQGLSNSITSDQALQASNLIGQYVFAPGNQGVLTTGGNLSGNFNLSSSATNTTVTISDATTGATVDQINLGSQAAGDVPFTWNGVTSSGATANPGLYNVKVTAMINGQNTAVKTNILSQVGSVSLGSGSNGLQLNLVGLGSVPFSSIKTIA